MSSTLEQTTTSILNGGSCNLHILIAQIKHTLVYTQFQSLGNWTCLGNDVTLVTFFQTIKRVNYVIHYFIPQHDSAKGKLVLRHAD